MNSKTRNIIGIILRYLVASASLSILMYVALALLFSTEEERLLQKENRLYRERYARMKEKERLIADVIDGLQEKDNAIYEGLFKTSAPSLDALQAVDVIATSDSLSEAFYLSTTASASGRLMLMAGNVDDKFREIFSLLETRKDSIPPLSLPLRGMSYVQAGASVGLKFNPVLQIQTQHDGLDLVAPQGDPVYAAAAGTVSQVIRSRKGLGNTVVIDHGNGYVTRYCLLGEMSVSKGKKVTLGQKIGTVGISASVTAPHLHFEVLHGDKVCDPVDFLFASLSPEEYSRIMYMAASTSQSMD